MNLNGRLVHADLFDSWQDALSYAISLTREDARRSVETISEGPGRVVVLWF